MGDAQGLGGRAVAGPQRGIDPLGQETDLVTLLTGKRVAVVVAHQDDESLWFGGLLSRLPKGTVTDLISLTRPAPARPDTTTRLNAFRQVAMWIGAMPKCLYLKDCKADAIFDDALKAVRLLVLEAVVEQALLFSYPRPDVVVCHGLDGEPCSVYPAGHTMHKLTAEVVAASCRKLSIPCVFRSPAGKFTVTFDQAEKKRLLDFYAPQWAPDAYPWREPERYDLLGVQSSPDANKDQVAKMAG